MSYKDDEAYNEGYDDGYMLKPSPRYNGDAYDAYTRGYDDGAHQARIDRQRNAQVANMRREGTWYRTR